jgi:hypothetical protein
METIMECSEPKVDPKTLEILKYKLLRIARTAESVALSSIRKVRFLAAVGMLSAGWLTIFLWKTFTLSLAVTLPLLLILALPSILLGKLYFVLRETVGLPQRLNESLDRIRTGTVELHQRLKKPDQFDSIPRKKKLTDLWRLAKTFRELKALGKKLMKLWPSSVEH